MIYILIPIIVFGIVYSIVYLVKRNSANKYDVFIKNNSIALKKIIELNTHYNFYPYNMKIIKNIYDNVNFYSTVSCEDYLIYQLQFKEFRNEVLNQINQVKNNKKMYNDYVDNLNYIRLGKYEAPIGKLKEVKLLELEKKEFDRKKLEPAIEYKLKVILTHVNMSGYAVVAKAKDFSDESIERYINELNNKNGYFYNSEFIWNAISRVERARVSNKMRFAIYKRDNYTCRMCHRRFDVNDLEIDHIYPIAKGGKSNFENLQTLCKICNKIKGDSVLPK